MLRILPLPEHSLPAVLCLHLEDWQRPGLVLCQPDCPDNFTENISKEFLLLPDGGERGEGCGKVLDHVAPQVEDTERGAEAELTRQSGEDVVPDREDGQLVEAAEVRREALQAVVAHVQVEQRLQLAHGGGEREQAVVTEGSHRSRKDGK